MRINQVEAWEIKKFLWIKKLNAKMFSWNSKKHKNLSNCFDLKDKKN